MSQRLALGLGRGCLQELAWRLAIGAVLIVLMVACLVPAVYLLDAYNPGQPAFFLGLALLAGFVVLTVAVVAGVAAWLLFRGNRAADAAFTPLGLKSGMYLLNGRQYRGKVGGRNLFAYFFRGPTVEVFVQANTRTRVSIGARNRLGDALAGLTRQTPLATSDPALERLGVYPADADWANALLAEPAARDALARLMTESDSIEIRQVLIQPNALLLRLAQTRLEHLHPAAIQSWVNDLGTLARLAESVPPTRQPLKPTPFEGGDPAARARTIWLGAGIALLIVFVIAACVILPALLLENR